MQGQAMPGRLVAAVGLVLGFIALWVDYAAGAKYSDDGTILTWLLILAILTALLWLGAMATGRRDLDVWTGVIGAVMFGFYLVLPVATAFDQWDQLDSGAWFGVCSGLIVVGVLMATWTPAAGAAAAPAPMGALLAVAGLVLVFVGIFPKAAEGFGSYWNADAFGHSVGIFLIILVVLTVLAIGATWMGMAMGDIALLLSGVTFGFTTAVVVGNAFNQLGDVKAGGWLAAVGGLLALAGAATMRQTAPAGAPAPQAPPAAPTPPPA